MKRIIEKAGAILMVIWLFVLVAFTRIDEDEELLN